MALGGVVGPVHPSRVLNEWINEYFFLWIPDGVGKQVLVCVSHGNVVSTVFVGYIAFAKWKYCWKRLCLKPGRVVVAEDSAGWRKVGRLLFTTAKSLTEQI